MFRESVSVKRNATVGEEFDCILGSGGGKISIWQDQDEVSKALFSGLLVGQWSFCLLERSHEERNVGSS